MGSIKLVMLTTHHPGGQTEPPPMVENHAAERHTILIVSSDKCGSILKFFQKMAVKGLRKWWLLLFSTKNALGLDM